jgi:hypothetical protein
MATTTVSLIPGVDFINILGALFCSYFGGKKLPSQNVTREKVLNLLLYKKRMCKMLMKLTPDDLLIVHSRGQFQQNFTSTFFDDIFLPKNYKAKM